jgi:hypothetical protein
MARALIPGFDPRPYWRVVEDSLVEIHGLPRGEARKLLSELKAHLRALPPDIDRDIIYHDEPINVASDLVDQNLPHETYRQKYDEILERHYPHWRSRRAEPSTSA